MSIIRKDIVAGSITITRLYGDKNIIYRTMLIKQDMHEAKVYQTQAGLSLLKLDKPLYPITNDVNEKNKAKPAVPAGEKLKSLYNAELKTT